jgi:hypothetical protein
MTGKKTKTQVNSVSRSIKLTIGSSMRQFLFIFSCLLITIEGFANSALINPTTPDLPPQILQKESGLTELARLDHLIEATTKSLDNQRKLREILIEYKQVEKLYLKNPEDKNLLFRFIKMAYQLLNSIKDNHLEHTFSPEFINELTLLSQIANKKGTSKP